MFTGIVKGLGTVTAIDRRDDFLDITVDTALALSVPEIGASVAVDGVCLTVIRVAPLSPPINGGRPSLQLTFSVMGETLTKTTITDRVVGDRVSLEQPLRMGDEFGGHVVLGHVDGVGTIVKKEIDGENCWMTIAAPEFFVKYVVQKGSIAIDGVSLTVCDPRPIVKAPSTLRSFGALEWQASSPINGGEDLGGIEFSVSLLPLTRSLTTLGFKNIGDRVNLEADYVLKAMVK